MDSARLSRTAKAPSSQPFASQQSHTAKHQYQMNSAWRSLATEVNTPTFTPGRYQDQTTVSELTAITKNTLTQSILGRYVVQHSIEERHLQSTNSLQICPYFTKAKIKSEVADASTGKYQQTAECRESVTVRVSPCLHGSCSSVRRDHYQYPNKNSSSTAQITPQIVTKNIPGAHVKEKTYSPTPTR